MMYKGDRDARLLALRHDRRRSSRSSRTEPRRAAGPRRRDPLRRDRAAIRAGCRSGTLEHIYVLRLLQRAGRAVPGDRAPAVRQRARCRRGTVELDVPDGLDGRAGRSASARSRRGASRRSRSTSRRPPTPRSTRTTRSPRCYRTGGRTGYTDNVVRIVSPVEGRFERWGKWEEYDNWLTRTAPRALRVGRSAGRPVDGHRRDDHRPGRRPQLVGRRRRAATVGARRCPAGLHGRRDRRSRTARSRPAPRRRSTFELTSTDASLPASQTATIPITTTYSAPAGSGSENLTMSLVPTTTIPQAAAAPARRRRPRARASTAARRSTSASAGRARELRTRRVDCGTAGRRRPATSTYAKVTLARRRPVLLHPRPRRVPELRGQAGRVRRALARGLGRDPDRPARHRVADQHGHGVDVQARRLPVHGRPERHRTATARTGRAGRATPTTTRATRPGRWRTPSTTRRTRPASRSRRARRWVGTNETTTDHAYAGGGYDLEVKIPLAVLPGGRRPGSAWG